jgi:hypothetical protein
MSQNRSWDGVPSCVSNEGSLAPLNFFQQVTGIT